MKLNIGQTIARLRHEKGITQEQLANAIGVSIPAVSKWETGQAYPDITLLTTIAEYFTASIDTLMDFRISERCAQLEDIKTKLAEYNRTGDFNSALTIVIDALKKYPNDFDFMMHAAHFLSYKGTSGIPDDEKATVLGESIKYFQAVIKACPEKWIVENAWNGLAHVYRSLGKYDKAIDALEKLNKGNEYAASITELKFKKGDITGAKRMLQTKLWNDVRTLSMLCGTLADCYRSESNMKMVLECKKLNVKVVELMTWDKPNYCDVIVSWCYQNLAKYYYDAETYEEAMSALERTAYHAVRFDENPSYAASDVKFMDSLKESSISNNSSGNKSYGLVKMIESDFPKLHDREKFNNIVAKLKDLAATRQETGFWK